MGKSASVGTRAVDQPWHAKGPGDGHASWYGLHHGRYGRHETTVWDAQSIHGTQHQTWHPRSNHTLKALLHVNLQSSQPEISTIKQRIHSGTDYLSNLSYNKFIDFNAYFIPLICCLL